MRGGDLPVNADFQSGFASNLDDLAVSVRLAVQAGVAGLSIEDRDVDAPQQLYGTAHAVERIRAARAAINASGEDVMLVARTEILLSEPGAIASAIEKLVAFADAGADCLYAPGVRTGADIAALVRAVAPRPLNVLMMREGLSVAELANLGVRRISVGGALARVAWGAMMAAAEQMKAGSFDGLAHGASGAQLNGLFDAFSGLRP